MLDAFSQDCAHGVEIILPGRMLEPNPSAAQKKEAARLCETSKVAAASTAMGLTSELRPRVTILSDEADSWRAYPPRLPQGRLSTG